MTDPRGNRVGDRVGELVALEFGPRRPRCCASVGADELAALEPDASRERPVWHLTGELDWAESSPCGSVRAVADGRLLAVAANAPRGRQRPRRGAGRRRFRRRRVLRAARETLLSTEYGTDGLPRRVGLELYRSEGGSRSGTRATRPARPSARRQLARLRRAGPAVRRASGQGRSTSCARLRNSPIKAVISDFGGVLTTPLMNSSPPFRTTPDSPRRSAGDAGVAEARRRPSPVRARERPDHRGRLPRHGRAALEPELGHRPEMHRFNEIYFEALGPNEAMIG